ILHHAELARSDAHPVRQIFKCPRRLVLAGKTDFFQRNNIPVGEIIFKTKTTEHTRGPAARGMRQKSMHLFALRESGGDAPAAADVRFLIETIVIGVMELLGIEAVILLPLYRRLMRVSCRHENNHELFPSQRHAALYSCACSGFA